MKHGKTVLALLTGLGLAFSPLTAAAQPGPEHCQKEKSMDHPMKGMFADLNLTADQKAKLKVLHEAQKDTHKKVFEQMKALREQVKAELLRPQPSKQVLDGYAAQMGNLHRELAQKRADHLLQVKTILTPEQFSKLLSRDPKGPRCSEDCKEKGKHGDKCCPKKETPGGEKKCCPHGHGSDRPDGEM
jgi:Spy/CpxP family protein refolding chaperone